MKFRTKMSTTENKLILIKEIELVEVQNNILRGSIKS